MPKLIDEPVASPRRDVPLEHQDEIARAVLRLTGQDRSVHELTPDEEADLEEADAEIARGAFATDEQVRALWAKHGLGGSSTRRVCSGRSMTS